MPDVFDALEAYFADLGSEDWIVQLECTTDGHNKFWRVAVDRKTSEVITQWGKIGTKAQESRRHFPYPDDQAWKKIDDKFRKGYVEI